MTSLPIAIDRPSSKDTAQLSLLISTVTVHAFAREQIELADPAILQNEIQRKLNDFHTDLDSEGTREHFLVARLKGKIVGCIAFGAVTQTLQENFPEARENAYEIKHMLVLPQYQSMGIGTMLFTSILSDLKKNGTITYYLDSGFKTAQKYWTNRIGLPTVVLQDLFGPGQDFMLWKRSLE